jgi:hypothetical protein
MTNQKGGVDPLQVAGETLWLPEPDLVVLPWGGRSRHSGGAFLGRRDLSAQDVLVRVFHGIGEGLIC